MIKNVLAVVLGLTALCLKAQTTEPELKTDSISAPTVPATELNEVEVTASSHIETATKVILHPTDEEKRYSTNAYQLVANMNLPDLVSSDHHMSINLLSGQMVQCLINGIEAQPEEVATLLAKEILSIEFQRTPGGKYVGKGGVMNFITRQYAYGGNLYLTADEGVAYQYGDYLGSANYKNGAWTISTLGSFKWDNDSKLLSSNNLFYLNSGSMAQQIVPVGSLIKSRHGYGRVKLSHAENNHSLNVTVELAANNIPTDTTSSLASYSGVVVEQSRLSRGSTARALSPLANVDYLLYINGNQSLNLMGTASCGKNHYRGEFRETGFDDITIDSEEDNQSYAGALTYYYYLPDNVSSWGFNANNIYTDYADTYRGNTNSKQKLKTNVALLLAQWQQTLSALNLYYYLSAGYSHTFTNINGLKANYCNPVAYYGGNLAINQHQSVALNGNYMHTMFNPEYKNALTLPSSFFQATQGNPNLGVLKAFQNYVTYNASFDKLQLSLSHDFMVYFDNIVNKYYVDNNIVNKMLINDGNFYSNRLIFSASYALLNNSLRFNGNSIAEIFHLKGAEYDCRHRGLRGSLSVAYFLRGWSVKATYATPYTTFTPSLPAYLSLPARYGVAITWNNDNLRLECGAENFAAKYNPSDSHFNYRSWNMVNSTERALSTGRNVYISLTYTLPYGKPTDTPDASYQPSINSALLRPF